MKKNKKFKVGILIINLFFTLLYFSIQFGGVNLSINDEGSGNKKITPILSDGNSISFEWYRTWGGGHNDYGYGVAVDLLDNVYLAGITWSYGWGVRDMVLVKYDEEGVQQWNCTWGGADHDYGYGVAVDSLDNVYITGGTHSLGAGGGDMVLVKYDGDGVQQWNRTWGGAFWDYGRGVAVDSFDNVYITGGTHSFRAGSADMVLVKYDGNGVQQWNRTWGGGDDDYGYGVAVDSLDNVFFAGTTYSFGAGYEDMVLVKYDGDGVQQWYRTWGGGGYDYGYGVAVDSLDNVYITGGTDSFGAGSYDMVLVKYDGNGVQQWNRTWGGGGYDGGAGVAVDSLDNVYITGGTHSFGAGHYDMVLVKYDGNGVQQWNRTWGGGDDDGGAGVAVDSLDNVYLAGATESFGVGYDDMVLVKYGIAERPPSDELIMILIIVVSIASVVGVGIAITYFIRKKRKIVE